MQKNQYVENKSLAMIACKCPRCQSGELFETKATNLNGFMKMHEFCPVCEIRYEVEPGFFWGAMYVSYAITTALMLITCGILLFGFNDPAFWIYVVSIIAIVFLTLPWVFRYSRVLLLYFISPIKFDINFIKN